MASTLPPAPKIMFIAPMKRYGGIERTLVSLARALVQRGIEVEFVLLRESETPYPKELPTSVRVTHLGTRSKLDGVYKIARHLRARRPDAVVTAKDHSAQAVLLAKMLWRIKVPVFVKVTNTWSKVILRPLQRRLVRALYPKADGIIAVSDGAAQDLIRNFRIPPTKVRVIYNPVVTPDFEARQEQPCHHPWLDSSSTSVPVVMGVGRLEEQKDFPLLLEAFALVRQNRKCRLIILGEGSQRPLLEKLIKNLRLEQDVSLPGYVDDPIPYIARASLFALSSRYEGFGIVLAEALACGTPVVSTNCPSGPSEILDQGRLGTLVPVGDAAALANAMEQTLDTAPTPTILKQGAVRFRIDTVVDQYLEYLGLGREEPELN